MFQTEPILFLQARGGAVLDGLMTFVSWFGYPAFYIVALCVILFAVDFRRGFFLLQLLLWTGGLTEILKNSFGLPRPYDADARVLDVTRGRIPRTELVAMGGHGFFELPQPAALEHVRALRDPSFGLPSGHTSGCLAFTGGLALVWQSRRGAAAALLAVLTMAFSRMYRVTSRRYLSAWFWLEHSHACSLCTRRIGPPWLTCRSASSPSSFLK